MIRVNVISDVFFVYDEGEWHILYNKKNKDGVVKEKIDFHGDLNRCISALGSYIPENREIQKELISAYKESLIAFKPLKERDDKQLTFNSQYLNPFISYYDISGANALIEYAYSTDHGMSETGYKKAKQYLTNYSQVANKILDIEVGERIIGNKAESNYLDIIRLLKEVSDDIIKDFS